MEYLGLIVSVGLLIWLALKGVDIIFAALLCSFLVILTNGLPLATGLVDYFSFGPLGAFTFAGKFFLLFVAGALFGRIMGDSKAATSIALAMLNRLGTDRVLWITTLSCALLTYGGVVVFVVIFAMYPLGLRLLEQSNVPKRLFCASLALGAGTFTLTSLPGTPTLQNAISAAALGTDLFAGFWIGLGGGALMLLLGMAYLERERRKAAAAGEGFSHGAGEEVTAVEQGPVPALWAAVLPIATVLLIILLPRLLPMILDLGTGQVTALSAVVSFAAGQPIVWPSIALFIGTGLALALYHSQGSLIPSLSRGTRDAIMPLVNTAAVIGFGGVVTHTAGFADFTSIMLESELPPLLSMFTSVSIVSAITGSGSGGLQIFMQTMAPAYLDMGIPAETLHRLAAMASGGFDSLPHCGAVVATLTITGLSHKEAYKDMAVITVIIPVAVTLWAIAFIGLSA